MGDWHPEVRAQQMLIIPSALQPFRGPCSFCLGLNGHLVGEFDQISTVAKINYLFSL